ncbi:ABC transporter permease [Candidatus Bathyarchaeota archaeon A05DMB-2]|jgi:ABC-type multidrug transport system permease subunit|nr:ABC transporter permease [Candidatus Bathyarchaeota archaeon A05DMB-2]
MSDALKDVYSILWVDLRNLRRHWRSLVATSLVQPLLYLVAFGYGLGKGISLEGVSYLAFVIPGIIALTSFSTSFSGAASKLQVDRFFYKSFDECLMSPVSLYSIIVGKALIGVIRGLISSFAILLVGLALSPMFIISPLFVLVLLVSCFVFALFGVLVAFVIDSHQGMSTFNSLVILPMTFLCGTFFSLSQLPAAAKAVLYVLPLTHSSECLRATALAQPFPFWSFCVLFAFGLAFFLASVFVLKKKSV